MALNRDQTGRPTKVDAVFQDPTPVVVEDCPRNAEIDAWLAGPRIRSVTTKSEGGRIVEVPSERTIRPQTIGHWSQKQIADTNKWRVSIVTQPDGQSRDFIVAKDGPNLALPTPAPEPDPVEAAPSKK